MTGKKLLASLLVLFGSVGCTPAALHQFTESMANLTTQTRLSRLQRRARDAERREREAIVRLTRIERRLEEMEERRARVHTRRDPRPCSECTGRSEPVARSVPPNPYALPPNPY